MESVPTLTAGGFAKTGLVVCFVAFGETKVHENSAPLVGLVEEVGRFDISVQNILVVNRCEGCEEGAEVDLDIWDGHLAEILTKICVSKVGKHSNDLICMSERGDERTDRVTSSEVVEKVEFVKDSCGTTGHIYLLDSNVFRATSGLRVFLSIV